MLINLRCIESNVITVVDNIKNDLGCCNHITRSAT